MRRFAPELRELALLHSIQLSFRDAMGQRRRPSPEALLATLRILGAPVERERDARSALEARRQELCGRGVEPVTVWWEGHPLTLPVIGAADGRGREFRLHLEEGGQILLQPSRFEEAPLFGGAAAGRYSRQRAHFAPASVPRGYHRLRVSGLDGEERETLVLRAPARSFIPPARRSWGVFAPVYGLQSRRDWGAGDLTDLATLIRSVAGMGGGGVATLPLLATFLEEPFEPSPYSPVSRLFWNELYLDPERIVEFRSSDSAREKIASAEFAAEREELRRLPLVDYRRVMRAKREILEILADEFFERGSDARREEFARFLEEKPRAEAYARFRAAVERGRWPGEAPANGLIELEPEEEPGRRYHLFAQWQCERQLESVAALARSSGFGLYLDVPLGVHGGGFDAWAERDLFARDVATGAPPDPFFTGGQNWGAPPLHPEKLRQSGYGYFIESLRAIMRYAGVLRFDHVMALHRLYWIPKDLDPQDGVYVRYATEESFAILAIESHRHRTRIVGEDLGTVPELVRSRMRQHAVRSMYVLQYEIGPDREPRSPSPTAVASLNTHDMPPFAGFLAGDDIGERAEQGHVEDLEAQTEERGRVRSTLENFLRERGLAEGGSAAALFEGATKFLARSDAELVLVNLEDLWQTTEAQNLPGTHTEHPNWRRKLARPIEELAEHRDLSARLGRVDAWRREGGHE